MKERCLIFSQRMDDETQPWESLGALREAQQPGKWLIWIKTKPPKVQLAGLSPKPRAGGSRVDRCYFRYRSREGAPEHHTRY